MNYIRRQRIGIIVVSIFFIAFAVGIMILTTKIEKDKEIFIVVHTSKTEYDIYPISKYSIEEDKYHYSITIYNRTNKNETPIEYKNWEYDNFEIIEKEDLPEKGEE